MAVSQNFVVLLVVANPKSDLKNLKREESQIKNAFLSSRHHIEVVTLNNPSVTEVCSAFKDYRNRISVFHFAGHANDFSLMLQSNVGQLQRADAGSFADFLAKQSSLKLVFLNGCSTKGQVDRLIQAGVNSVIATECPIDDRVATEFAYAFYTSLISDLTLEAAFEEASSQTLMDHGGQSRALYADVPDDVDEESEHKLPWRQYFSTDDAKLWNFRLENKRLISSIQNENRTTPERLDELLQVLDEVHSSWVDECHQDWLKGRPPIALSIRMEQEAVASGYQRSQKGLTGSGNGITNANIIDILDESGQSLLVLGQPGSGKTTALIEIAKELVDRARADIRTAVPIVVLLSLWNESTKSVEQFIDEQLVRRYGRSRGVARDWLEDRRLYLLLDGLDEMAEDLRLSFVRALNSYIESYSRNRLIVTCRSEEYGLIGEKLNLSKAICLQPLDDAQIDLVLSDPRDGNPALRLALESSDDLRAIARAPLMFSIIRESFEDDQTIDISDLQTADDWRKHVFDGYVNTMINRWTSEQDPFESRQTLDYLHRLAAKMRDQSATLFLIEHLQPTQLNTKGQVIAYRMLVSLVFGLMSGLAITFLYWCMGTVSNDTQAAMRAGLVYTITPSMLVWVAMVSMVDHKLPFFAGQPVSARAVLVGGARKTSLYFSCWVLVALPSIYLVPSTDAIVLLGMAGVLTSSMLAAFGFNRPVFDCIRPVEAISYSGVYAIRGMVWGVSVGFLLWFILWLGWDQPKLNFFWQEFGPPYSGRAIWFVILATLGASMGGIVGSIVPGSIKDKIKVNQGMRLSLLNALMVGAMGAIAAAALMVGYTLMIKQRSLSTNYPVIIAVSLTVSYIATLWFGGFELIKHTVLRLVMASCGLLPLRLNRFLNHAKRLRFMRRAGGGYLFLHRMLLDYFADRR